MNAANEREFRSFFDKIIQLPFSMPVANYKIDDFLMESLSEIGYIDANEKKDKSLCESISYYALQSVGTNPRSLKRLINYLSLIKLIIAQTPTQDDDADFKEWKDVLFALVSLQIQYPKVYEALQGDGDSDFTSWGEEFEQKWRIPPLKDGEKEKLRKMVEFDEPWEQMLFRFCRLDTFLESRSINISRALNRIKARILDANQPVGDTVAWLLRLSAVTSVKSEAETAAVPENFNKSNYLKDLRRHALGMRPGEGVPWCAVLGDDAVVTSYQARVQSNLQCQFRKGTLNGIAPNKKDYIHENYLAEFSFHIFHDGRSFQLKVWGEFWGRNNNPAKRFHIKFDGPNIQTDLESAENAVRDAWSAFDVKANCGHNPDDIWWNVTVPFKARKSCAKVWSRSRRPLPRLRHIEFHQTTTSKGETTMSEYCKYCGTSARDARSLLSNNCPKHPNGFCKGKHALYEGGERSEYVCVYCGTKNRSLSSLLSNSCPKHPDGFAKGKHVAYDGRESGPYECKYCGREFRDIASMVSNSCPKHPAGFAKGKHSPAR